MLERKTGPDSQMIKVSFFELFLADYFREAFDRTGNAGYLSGTGGLADYLEGVRRTDGTVGRIADGTSRILSKNDENAPELLYAMFISPFTERQYTDMQKGEQKNDNAEHNQRNE